MDPALQSRPQDSGLGERRGSELAPPPTVGAPRALHFTGAAASSAGCSRYAEPTLNSSVSLLPLPLLTFISLPSSLTPSPPPAFSAPWFLLVLSSASLWSAWGALGPDHSQPLCLPEAGEAQSPLASDTHPLGQTWPAFSASVPLSSLFP